MNAANDVLPPHRPLTILLAEDDDGHAELIEEQLRNSGLYNPIQRFGDGQEIWDFLQGDEDWSGHLLLLDIRMPRLDGIEVLRRIKENTLLRQLPVIMLTTTDDPREVAQCYELGCNCYITKPVDFSQFTSTLAKLGLFLQVVRIP